LRHLHEEAPLRWKPLRRKMGQVAVIVRGEDVTYLLAGDISYKQQNLIEDKVDGVTYSVETSLATQRAVKAFASSEPSVLLLGHDPGVPERLANKRVLFDTETAVAAL
jgi:N-acyl homoserine lactone hydrolase